MDEYFFWSSDYTLAWVIFFGEDNCLEVVVDTHNLISKIYDKQKNFKPPCTYVLSQRFSVINFQLDY